MNNNNQTHTHTPNTIKLKENKCAVCCIVVDEEKETMSKWVLFSSILVICESIACKCNGYFCYGLAHRLVHAFFHLGFVSFSDAYAPFTRTMVSLIWTGRLFCGPFFCNHEPNALNALAHIQTHTHTHFSMAYYLFWLQFRTNIQFRYDECKRCRECLNWVCVCVCV